MGKGWERAGKTLLSVELLIAAAEQNTVYSLFANTTDPRQQEKVYAGHTTNTVARRLADQLLPESKAKSVSSMYFYQILQMERSNFVMKPLALYGRAADASLLSL